MITLELTLDHARELVLALRLRTRVTPCGTRRRLIDEVLNALGGFVTVADMKGVPADGCCQDEKTLDLREKGSGV